MALTPSLDRVTSLGKSMLYFGGPGVKSKPTSSQQTDSFSRTVSTPPITLDEKQRLEVARRLAVHKKALEKERAEWMQSEKKQKEEVEARDRQIMALQIQIEELQKPDYAAMGANFICALCSLVGLWLAWLTYRGPRKVSRPRPPPVPSDRFWSHGS